MHTFLIMKKKLGSELIPTSHLIRVLRRSCQPPEPWKEGRSCRGPWTGAWQRPEPLHPAPPWARTRKDLQEIASCGFLEFTFSGRNCWISRINHLWPLAANKSMSSKPEPVRVAGKELGCRAREGGGYWQQFASPSSEFTPVLPMCRPALVYRLFDGSGSLWYLRRLSTGQTCKLNFQTKHKLT